MDLLSLLRMLGGLGVVLGLLAGALWLVRRYDLKLPGRVAGGATRRLELIEKLPIDSRRSIALIRRDGREHLILLAPEGSLVVESAILRDEVDRVAEEARKEAELERAAEAEAQAEAMRESFAGMVDKVRERVRPRRGGGDEEADA
jgi:flagellar biogenesis protein FliO